MSNERNKKFWVFNAGNYFSGNPKWLFLYLVKNHPDIEVAWLCYRKSNLDYVRSLGYTAHLYSSPQGKEAMGKAGVYVVEQVKEIIQPQLVGATILNLFHGVGCKTIETKMTTSILDMQVATKYIRNKQLYHDYQLFLVTSPLMEKHFMAHCALREDHLVRAGYPRCFSGLTDVHTFDHQVIARKKRSSNTRVALYVPTYRDNGEDFLSRALPDIDRLCATLEKQNILLVVKMHPAVEQSFSFKRMKEAYQDNANLLFWDNTYDMYEVLDAVDLAIVDYSSMFYDILAAGTRHFIRYFYDIDEVINDRTQRDFALDVPSHTCGPVASSFDELLQLLGAVDWSTPDSGCDAIMDQFWAYAEGTSMETIVDAALAFTPQPDPLPTLHSFDVFDTVITRSCWKPAAIFFWVQTKITQAGSYPASFATSYPDIRHWCEMNARQLKTSSVQIANDDRTEISFEMIFDRMKDMYGIADAQAQCLMDWELEAEYAASQPIPQRVQEIEKLVESGDDVVFISDMYLPESFVKKLLTKASPLLAQLPLFLSSTTGHQKTRYLLFLDVYHGIDYRYGSWYHTGDNKNADVRKPKELAIKTHLVDRFEFDDFEKEITAFRPSYGLFEVADIYRRNRMAQHSDIDLFAFTKLAMLFVPYVNWAIRDAMSRGIRTLYFISRDGYLLKQAADAIISQKKLPVRTKYIYGSRKAWRVPSYIDAIDDDFFMTHGNFADVRSFDNLLKVLKMDAPTFQNLFPDLQSFVGATYLHKDTVAQLADYFKQSDVFKAHLLAVAQQERTLVLDYLKQEIDFSEPFAFVEYWGRGYTQECMNRLLRQVDAQCNPPMYYLRSIYPSNSQCLRPNFTTNNVSPIFVEALFANIPYLTVTGYKHNDSTVEACFAKNPHCNTALLQALEGSIAKLAGEYCIIPCPDVDELDRTTFDFTARYFQDHKTDADYLRFIAPLKDSVGTVGNVREFAPRITMKSMKNRALKNKTIETSSRAMTLARSSAPLRWASETFHEQKKNKGTLYKIAKKLHGRK